MRKIRDRAVVFDAAAHNLQRWSLRLVAVAAAVFIIGWSIGALWVILFPVCMALLLATVLSVPTSWMRRRGLPTGLAAAATMIGFFAVLVVMVWLIIPQVSSQAPTIANQAADGLAEVRTWMVDGPLGLTQSQIANLTEVLQDRLRESAATISSGALSTVSAATGALINTVVILMLTFFFIKDGYRFLPWLHAVLGRRAGDHATAVLGRMWLTIGGFIRTQTFVAFIDGLIIGIGLAILGVPLAFPLGVITFFASFIPIVGALVSGVLAVLVTLVTNDPQAALIALIIVVAVQQIEGNVLSPLLQSRSMNLHPAVVLLSVTAGGTLFGITGAFLAVPVSAAFSEALRYVNENIDRAVDAGAPPEDSQSAEMLHDGPPPLDQWASDPQQPPVPPN